MTDFAAALEAHLDTIRRRDLDAFTATVHKDVSVVLPNGRLLAGRDEVVAFHREWFADTGWRMETTLERTHPGVALFAVQYHEEDGSVVRYRLGLVFTQEDDEWLLIHDQNTRT